MTFSGGSRGGPASAGPYHQQFAPGSPVGGSSGSLYNYNRDSAPPPYHRDRGHQHHRDRGGGGTAGDGAPYPSSLIFGPSPVLNSGLNSPGGGGSWGASWEVSPSKLLALDSSAIYEDVQSDNADDGLRLELSSILRKHVVAPPPDDLLSDLLDWFQAKNTASETSGEDRGSPSEWRTGGPGGDVVGEGPPLGGAGIGLEVEEGDRDVPLVPGIKDNNLLENYSGAADPAQGSSFVTAEDHVQGRDETAGNKLLL